MLITNHVVAGAVIGAVAPGPASAFVLGIASHVVMDALPHWGHPDYGVFIKVAVVDGLVGLATLATWRAPPPRTGEQPSWPGCSGPACPTPTSRARCSSAARPSRRGWTRCTSGSRTRPQERMPYEALGGLVGALVVRAWLRRR